MALRPVMGEQGRHVVRRLLAAAPPKGEVAVYIEVPPGIQDPFRHQWHEPTHLVAVARNGRVEGVFFSRKNQLNKKHLRVKEVRRA